MDVLVFTVSDRLFFPGTLAAVNSILRYHDDYQIVVVDNGLTAPQRSVLDHPNVRVMPADRFARPGRFMGPWELKAYAASDLSGECEVLIGIDSDCLICSSLTEEVARCAASKCWLGGKDADQYYDSAYGIYGMPTPSHSARYMSTSLYFCPITSETRALLAEWARCCSQAVFNRQDPYPGHGDQGVLNAILWARNGSQNVELLDNELWSQHWAYWQDTITVEQGRILNCARLPYRPQRSFHCGGTEKFWTVAHTRRVTEDHMGQAVNYAWFLAMLWFGACRRPNLDPYAYLAPESHHLIGDLVNFFHYIAAVLPAVRERWCVSDAMLERMLQDIRRCMSLGASLRDYIELAAGVPTGGRLIEVGSLEGGSILAVAISLLHRDVVCYSVESFLGNLNGTVDGYPLPSLPAYRTNLHQRYPHLRLISCPGFSVEVASTYPDEHFDLVFLDAAHDTASVTADIRAWLPKVKPGGVLAGDDWGWDSVRAAVVPLVGVPQVTASRCIWWVRRSLVSR